jgi:bacitracin transport system permease protein
LLNLIQTEFLKLRRRTFIGLMLLAALFMPLVAILYFRYAHTGEITPISFYRWTALSYTPWIILPIVLGMLSSLLMHDENQNDTLKQLWMIPVSRIGYFASKFVVVWVYAMAFMLIVFAASVMAGVLTGIIPFMAESIRVLFLKCLEIGGVWPFAMLPVLAVAASQKGYILPVCVTIVYTFLGFILLMVNMYLHPLSSATALLIRNMEGVDLKATIDVAKAILGIGLWAIVSTLWATIRLRKGS